MYNMIFNNNKYINGGTLKFINSRTVLVLVDPLDYKKEFIGINTLSDGSVSYYELPISIKEELYKTNSINNCFNLSETTKKISKVSQKAFIFTVTAIMLLAAGNFVLERFTPYNGQIIMIAAVNEVSSALDIPKEEVNKVVLNKDISEEDKKILTESLNKIEVVFKDYDKPYLYNLNTLTIKELTNEEIASEENYGVASYDVSNNCIRIPNKEYLDSMASLKGVSSGNEIKVSAIKHDGWHVITTNRNKKSVQSFGYSISEGVDAIVQYELFGDEPNRRSHMTSQYIVRALQEVIDPHDIVQSRLSDNINIVLEDLTKVYGNKLDAVKLINSADMYSINHDALERTNIDYSPSQIEILRQLYVYEKAKITADIQNDIYHPSEFGLKYFVGQVQYVLNLNNSTFEFNEENQAILDEMRLKFEGEVYEIFAAKHSMDSNILKDIQASEEHIKFNKKYYDKQSRNNFEIVERNLRKKESYIK